MPILFHVTTIRICGTSIKLQPPLIFKELKSLATVVLIYNGNGDDQILLQMVRLKFVFNCLARVRSFLRLPRLKAVFRQIVRCCCEPTPLRRQCWRKTAFEIDHLFFATANRHGYIVVKASRYRGKNN